MLLSRKCRRVVSVQAQQGRDVLLVAAKSLVDLIAEEVLPLAFEVGPQQRQLRLAVGVR